MRSGHAVIALMGVAITTTPGRVSAFGSSPGALTGGHVNTLVTTSSTSSFLKVGGGSRSSGGEGSSTSLWSAYAVKPDMAKKQGSEWRKLRTRGPGFGEKVRRAKPAPDLSEKLALGLSYLNADEAEEIQQALAMAMYAHSLKAEAGSFEGVKAGVETCLILGELGMGTDALVSAILSGVLRPDVQPSEFGRAAVTVEDIEEGFGARVARSVKNLEHVMSLEELAQHRMRRRAVDEKAGADMGRRQGHHLRDFIISEVADWQVLTLYLAVHMQELRSAITSGASDAAQLARDALEIHAPLAHHLGVHHLSGGLEDLAFQALYPKEYSEIRAATQARIGVYQEVMETAKRAVSQALKQDKTFMSQLQGDVILQHRIKEPYSMWKKMSRQGGGIDRVYDAVALRVVLKVQRRKGETDESYDERSKQLCYKAMSVAKRTFPAVEGRSKDYVLNPKSNGYQSLHSTHEVALLPATAWEAGLEDRQTHFELQVRTAAMHHTAEYGHAAHWSYKTEGKDRVAKKVADKKTWKASRPRATGSPGLGKGRPAVPDTVSSGRELITWLHLELRQRKVFVFGPDNLIWELDKASATAEKVLRSTHNAGVSFADSSEFDGIGNGRSAFVNGKAVPRHYAFKNGDVLDVSMAA
ncbi:unnamed protein product [Sphacelaria rigidula]